MFDILGAINLPDFPDGIIIKTRVTTKENIANTKKVSIGCDVNIIICEAISGPDA